MARRSKNVMGFPEVSRCRLCGATNPEGAPVPTVGLIGEPTRQGGAFYVRCWACRRRGPIRSCPWEAARMWESGREIVPIRS